MKKLPKRPISHILEEDSLKFVKRTFPKEWIVEEIKNDYGVDLELEIVENEEVTGAHFLIQLKSSNSLVINKKGFISHSCKTSTLQYFLERPELFIYLVYDSINDIGYWIWIQDFLRAQPSPDWKKQQTFTIKIPKDNVLNNLSIESIKKRVLKNHEKGKLINTIETLDHPGIRYGVEFNENTTVISAYSKYPGAELDYPLNFGLTLNFDESEEGKKTKKAWEDAFKKGTRAEIKAPFIKDFKIPKELDFDSLLFEDEFKPDGLIIQPLKRDRKFLAKIEVFNKKDELVAEVPYIEFREVRYGSDEVLMSNDHQPIPAKFSLLTKIPERECILSFQLNHMGWNVSQVKSIMDLEKSFALGGWLNIVHLDTNRVLMRYDFPENLISKPLEVHIEVANHLTFIQNILKTDFLWPDKISIEEYHLLKEIVGILKTGEILKGNSVNFGFDKISAQNLAKYFSKNEKMKFVFDGNHDSIILFDKEIKLGSTRVLIGSAKPTETTMNRLSSLETLSHDEIVKIELEVDDPGVIIQYLEWLPKNKNGE